MGKFFNKFGQEVRVVVYNRSGQKLYEKTCAEYQWCSAHCDEPWYYIACFSMQGSIPPVIGVTQTAEGVNGGINTPGGGGSFGVSWTTNYIKAFCIFKSKRDDDHVGHNTSNGASNVLHCHAHGIANMPGAPSKKSNPFSWEHDGKGIDAQALAKRNGYVSSHSEAGGDAYSWLQIKDGSPRGLGCDAS